MINSDLDSDFTQVTNQLFIGNANTANNKELLSSLNITTVVIAAKEICPIHTRTFCYCHLVLQNTNQEHLLPRIDDCYDYINEVRIQGQGVMVCCSHGLNRSAAIVIGYLIRLLKLDYYEAFGVVWRKRGYISPNPGFQKQLKQLSHQVRTKKTQNDIHQL